MSALPEALKSITATKIDELKKQREIYETAKQRIIGNANEERDLPSKVDAAIQGLAGIENVRLIAEDGSDINNDFFPFNSPAFRLKNLQRFIRQAKKDPSFAKSTVKLIGADLSRDLELGSRKHEYAEFFSALVTEWLTNEDESEASKKNASSSNTDGDTFESVGRREMHEQRAEWESLVFSLPNVDEAKIKSYLDRLFTTDKTVAKSLEILREITQNFAATVPQFDAASLKTSINGVLKTDLLTAEKRTILKTFLSNKDVLIEVADVLNMRMKSLSTWVWSAGPEKGIKLEQRKQLNGKYRVFMDEDVLDAIMLHSIGVHWAVHFKSVFTIFFNSQAWKWRSNAMPFEDQMRREYFLGEKDRQTGIESKRMSMYAKDYFMTQLPITEDEGVRGYDNDGDSEEDAIDERKSPLKIKHSLLHLVICEALIAKDLRPKDNHTIFRSDFKWFGPSLPHSSIFTVLEFLGVNESWLTFFKRFLAAPLSFVQDGPNAEVHVRARGVPMSHSLSDVFGEVVMFCLDFSVNLATEGSLLYRLHDDFWFWGSKSSVSDAWQAMREFAETMGIDFNKDKTGTVKLRETADSDSDVSEVSNGGAVETTSSTPTCCALPTGEIRWGFVVLDPGIGQFVIDQDMVDNHVKELQLQLSNCNSVFAWIQAYNAYLARFFTNNFGKPSHAFGLPHIDAMIDTFARVQKVLFPNGSVTDYLRTRIETDFGVTDLPDGIFYWPINLGGLELRNPLVPLFSMRESIRKTPVQILSKALIDDEALYASTKKRFEEGHSDKGLAGTYSTGYIYVDKAERGKFISKEEFMKYREQTSPYLIQVYDKLLEVPEEVGIYKTPQISSWLESLPAMIRGKSSSGIGKDFTKMQPYWKWMVGLHGAEMVEKYGGLQIVESGKVPVGIVGVLKQGKVRWTG